VLAALVAGGCGIGVGTSDLTSIVWQWERAATPAEETAIPDPANYTIQFADDGTYAAQADCNQLAGSYTISERSITIEQGPGTLAFCGDASLDSVFTAGLFGAESFALVGTELELMDASGDVMVFGPQN
jgi:heat shock protein HslJ